MMSCFSWSEHVEDIDLSIDVSSPHRSGNGGNGGGGGSFLSYLQEQTGPGWIPVTDPTQAWVGSQPKPRQAMDTMISSVCNAVDGDLSRASQEALLQPVRDTGHSEMLRGHFRGTQPFEKGLGFPHRVPEPTAWGQVSVPLLPRKIRGTFVLYDNKSVVQILHFVYKFRCCKGFNCPTNFFQHLKKSALYHPRYVLETLIQHFLSHTHTHTLSRNRTQDGHKQSGQI